MGEIRSYPVVRHYRGEPGFHVMRYANGRLKQSGAGLAFWFHPLSAAIVEVPLEDRDQPFLFHGRSSDFEDVTVQGVIGYRVIDAELLSRRVDFSIDLRQGMYQKEPIEKLSSMLSELAQQFAMEHLARNDLKTLLEGGMEALRERIREGFAADGSLEQKGLELVSVRISAVRPTADVEKALQTPTREAIQERADEAMFQRRAKAVEKERAIQENELNNRIELARREETMIEQEGANARRQKTDQAEAAMIDSRGKAERTAVETEAEAGRIRKLQDARTEGERARMDVYKSTSPDMMLGLAVRDFAAKLNRIENFSITPDMLAGFLKELRALGTSGAAPPTQTPDGDRR